MTTSYLEKEKLEENNKMEKKKKGGKNKNRRMKNKQTEFLYFTNKTTFLKRQ
jgi:hypothetical protein